MMKKRVRFLLLSLVLCMLLSACAPTTPPTGETPGGETPGGETPGDEIPGETPGEPEEEEPVIDPKDYVEGTLLYAEQGRQQFHYSDQNSWMNDINGLVYFGGVWHLYYQCNPGTTMCNTNDMHWGHATSSDLLHWQQHEPALYPDKDGSMWSGTAYADEDNRSGLFQSEKGGIIAAYSTEKQEIGLAYSEDGFTYEKLGIVIRNPGNRVDFRDPKIFYDEESGKWTMVVAGGKVRFYQSEDLATWALTSENEIWTECPDFFPMQVAGEGTTKWVLSCAGRSFYVGSYQNGVFTPESGLITTNQGPDSYAGIVFDNAPNGRILMMHWMNQWSYAQATAKEWCSNASLVHELTLSRHPESGAYVVGFRPAEEYAALSGKTLLSLSGARVEAGQNPLAGIKGTYLRMDATISLADTADFALALRLGQGDAVRLSYQAAENSFTFDRSQNSAAISNLTQTNSTYTFSSDYGDGNTLHLTIFVDAAGFELYADEATYFAALIGVQDASRAMSLETEGGVFIESLTVSEMGSIWFAEEPNAVHMPKTPIEVVMAEGALFVPVSALGGKKPVFYTVGDEALLKAEAVEGGVSLTGLAVGETTLRAHVRERYMECKVIIHAETTRVSQLGSFTVYGGTLTEKPDGYTLYAPSGDGFAISDSMAGDVIYSAAITLEKGAHAAALAFRMNGDQNFYCVCIDMHSQYVKLWMRKNGAVSDLRTVGKRIEPGVTYALRIEAIGNVITVFLNDREIMRVVNGAHTYGALGINVYVGGAHFNSLVYEAVEDKTPEGEKPLYDVTGGWLEETDAGLTLYADSWDAFAISDVKMTDFYYEADITVDSSSRAAALAFRMNGDQNFYCVCIDLFSQYVKLWMKEDGAVTDVQSVQAEIKANTVYRLRIEAVGTEITVYLNGIEIMRLQNTAHSTGTLGLNVCQGKGYFTNIRYGE